MCDFTLIHAAPLACRECVQLLKELGRVEYIVLTTHAYEHKLFVAPFSRKFPDAEVGPRSHTKVVT